MKIELAVQIYKQYRRDLFLSFLNSNDNIYHYLHLGKDGFFISHSIGYCVPSHEWDGLGGLPITVLSSRGKYISSWEEYEGDEEDYVAHVEESLEFEEEAFYSDGDWEQYADIPDIRKIMSVMEEHLQYAEKGLKLEAEREETL